MADSRNTPAMLAIAKQRRPTGSSVEQISAEAGYTRGAFYSNFTSKDEVLVELLRDRVYTRYTNMVEEGPRDLRRDHLMPTPRAG